MPLYRQNTEIPLNFSEIYENAPGARVAHARLLLEAVKFSSELSGHRMVDSGRSEGEDSDDGGFDVRWWLMRENRRFEASGGRPKSRHFSGQIGRRNRFNLPGFCFIWGYKPLCGFSEASNGRKWEIGWERENRRREERETPRLCYGVNASMIQRCSWRFVTVRSRLTWSSGCDWLDLQVDRTVRMGWFVIGYGAVYLERGTPGDVATQDRRTDCFKGWDGCGF